MPLSYLRCPLDIGLRAYIYVPAVKVGAPGWLFLANSELAAHERRFLLRAWLECTFDALTR